MIRNILRKEGIQGKKARIPVFAHASRLVSRIRNLCHRLVSWPAILPCHLRVHQRADTIGPSPLKALQSRYAASLFAVPRRPIFLHSELAANALAGIAAEGASVFSFLPADIVTQRLQIESRYNFMPFKYRNHGAMPVIRAILQNEGMRGFFRGLTPYLIVFGPGSAIWWVSYEWTKNVLQPLLPTRAVSLERRPQDHLVKATSHLVCGSLAGISSVLVTNPLDVARTRLQLLECRHAGDRRHIKGGFVSVLLDAYKNEGLQGLYKGARPRILIKIPGSAMAFLGYEYLKDFVAIKSC